MEIYTHILNNRLNEIIREREGGTYQIDVYSQKLRVPSELFTLNINFQCSNENREKLIGLIEKEIKKFSENPIQESEIENIKTMYRKALGSRKKKYKSIP